MISIGNTFPEFKKAAVISTEKGKEFMEVTSDEHKDLGMWMVMFWYPKDFSFVCPTEIKEFNNQYDKFHERDAMVIGASTDTELSHLAWRKTEPDLTDLKYPLLADTSKSLAEELGILESKERVAYRVTYIVDPDGVIRWMSAYDLSVGRNVDEILRVLDALQTDELCPCNWKKGDPTIKES